MPPKTISWLTRPTTPSERARIFAIWKIKFVQFAQPWPKLPLPIYKIVTGNDLDKIKPSVIIRIKHLMVLGGVFLFFSLGNSFRDACKRK